MAPPCCGPAPTLQRLEREEEEGEEEGLGEREGDAEEPERGELGGEKWRHEGMVGLPSPWM